MAMGQSDLSARQEEYIMEAIIILAILAALLVLDVLAIRYGADSRVWDNSRPNW